jgi:hypothetical protein
MNRIGDWLAVAVGAFALVALRRSHSRASHPTSSTTKRPSWWSTARTLTRSRWISRSVRTGSGSSGHHTARARAAQTPARPKARHGSKCGQHRRQGVCIQSWCATGQCRSSSMATVRVGRRGRYRAARAGDRHRTQRCCDFADVAGDLKSRVALRRPSRIETIALDQVNAAWRAKCVTTRTKGTG